MSNRVELGDLVAIEDIRSKSEKLYTVDEIFIVQDSVYKEQINTTVYRISSFPNNNDFCSWELVKEGAFKKIYKEVKINE